MQRIESYFGERRTTGADAVAGALIGGIAGNEIEKNKNQTWYDITMRMNDGRAVVVSQNSLNGIREGYRVVIRQGNSCRVGRQPEVGDVVKKEFDRLPPPTMRVESDT